MYCKECGCKYVVMWTYTNVPGRQVLRQWCSECQTAVTIAVRTPSGGTMWLSREMMERYG